MFSFRTKRQPRHRADHTSSDVSGGDPFEGMADRRLQRLLPATEARMEADREHLAEGLGVLTEQGVQR